MIFIRHLHATEKRSKIQEQWEWMSTEPWPVFSHTAGTSVHPYFFRCQKYWPKFQNDPLQEAFFSFLKTQTSILTKLWYSSFAIYEYFDLKHDEILFFKYWGMSEILADFDTQGSLFWHGSKKVYVRIPWLQAKSANILAIPPYLKKKIKI